jgi:soluble lytic murein transglycosylase-like protein
MNTTKTYLRLTAILTMVTLFFRTGLSSGHPVSDTSARTPLYASALIDRFARMDSTEAADVFLCPFKPEIDSVAKKHKLPPALLAAFIQEESAFNPDAIRTEPGYLHKQKVIAGAREWSRRHGGLPTVQTEIVLRASSMGLMQPLGQVAREQGFDARYLVELIKPYNSLDEGAKHLLTKLRKYPKDTLSAISAYNQGNNRKKHGTFENARYVYRVAVAWKVYDKLFTTPYEPINYKSKQHKTNEESNHNRRNNTQYSFRNALTQLSLHQPRPATVVSSTNNRETSGSETGLGGSHDHYIAKIYFTKSESKPDNAPRKTTPIIGLCGVVGLGGVLLYKRYHPSISRHRLTLPQSVDERVRARLERELASSRRDSEVHGAGFGNNNP